MKIALDSDCFIHAVNADAHAYASLKIILSASEHGAITVMVSRHTLHELSRKPDQAYELAKTFEVLPHWPIGTIAEQVAMIKDLAGTWEDARRNEKIQAELQVLAKSGNDIRDRGAYLDALHAGMQAFVTSDRQLVGSGPARRLEKRFGLRVVTPRDLAHQIETEQAAG